MTHGRDPNVFVIGAPKAGTTSLARYLGEHPNGFVGYPKEPSYWSRDLAASGAVASIDTRTRYRDVYRSAGSARAVVDASTRYLYSDVAVRDIVDAVPDARFVVILRPPVEVAHAYHMEKVFNCAEDEPDFERAWRLQDRRRAGLDVPTGCPEPRELLYRDVAALGSQLRRADELIPRGRLLVLFHDDLREDPRSLWIELQRFLGLADDGRTEFPAEGSAHFQRFPRLAKWYQAPPPAIAPTVRGAKRVVRTGRLGAVVGPSVKRLLVDRRHRAALDPAFAGELADEFVPEVELIEHLTGRDLTTWKRPA